MSPGPLQDTAGGLLQRWANGRRPWLLVVLLGAALYLPGLGKTGLWDPWETHYAEVAREMVVSGNWLEPTWEHSPGQELDRKYFFSKPALSMWLMAAGMQLFGIHDPAGGIADGAEWFIRLPFALLAIVGLLGAFALGRRFFGPTVGLVAAVILGTCPQYYFVARQAMTDMPLVGLMTAGMALLACGGLDDEPRPRLLYAGYLCLGLAVLAKGLVGFALPGLVFLVYFIVSGDWARLRRMRLVTGGALALVVAAPWYVYLSLASAARGLLDDEGKTFFQRFFIHDHLHRLASGVHGDRGTFAYFIKQLGIGTQPWFPFMLWGGVRSALRLDGGRERDRRQRAELFVFVWALVAFGLYSLSVTKFHHYALPAVPAMAVLAARWLVAWRHGAEPLAGRLVPLGLILLLVLISRDIGLLPKSLTDLFVYKYERPFPEAEALVGRIGFAVLFGLVSLILAGLYLTGRDRLRRWALPVLLAGGLASGVWGGWYFFNQMGPHWSQRQLFDTYYALRGADDPIGAYMMNWRGETFYSRNQVAQLKNNSRLHSWLHQHRGQRLFLLVERNRLRRLKRQLPPALRRNVRILDRSCIKFYLLSTRPQSDLPATGRAAAGGETR